MTKASSALGAGTERHRRRPGYVLGPAACSGRRVHRSGHPGAGKTIFGNQVAYHHAGHGGRVLYVTLLAEMHARMLLHLASFFDPTLVPSAIVYLSAFSVCRTRGSMACWRCCGARSRRVALPCWSSTAWWQPKNRRSRAPSSRSLSTSCRRKCPSPMHRTAAHKRAHGREGLRRTHHGGWHRRDSATSSTAFVPSAGWRYASSAAAVLPARSASVSDHRRRPGRVPAVRGALRARVAARRGVAGAALDRRRGARHDPPWRYPGRQHDGADRRLGDGQDLPRPAVHRPRQHGGAGAPVRLLRKPTTAAWQGGTGSASTSKRRSGAARSRSCGGRPPRTSWTPWRIG